MSKSRLEKFLYALYSLDSSDLPTPLSRIEELYKCWVTGEEAPSFEPISRVEKYLMAILGAYDADSLPNPLSRVEVLLYKLATGDDNLDDVKSFLSEHEELLAEIIRNGGVGGNIDIEYVLYTLSTEHNTLYNTAEKPVKSAILKGQTLVNICKPYEFDIQTTGSGIRHIYDKKYAFNIPIQDDKQYSIWIEIDINEIGAFSLSHTGAGATLVFDSVVGLTLTHGSTIIYPCVKRSNSTNVNFSIGALAGSTEGRLKGRIMVFEGDIRAFDLSYFTGMQSVKMPVLTTTGKNLFDGELEIGGLNINDGLPNTVQSDRYRSKNYTEVQSSTKYVAYNNYSSTIGIREYDEDYKFISWTSLGLKGAFTTSNNTKYLKFIIINKNDDNLLQLEQGEVSTSFEPFKSNILTVNEPIELRGIGEVKDELNLLTGKVVNKFGEIVLNGDENWRLYGNQPNQVNTVAFKFSLTNHTSSWATGMGYCDRLPFTNGAVMYGQDLECVTTDANHLVIRASLSKASSVDEFKAWLSNDNIRVVYPFKEEVIKTVDLSVVDQDGNSTKLSTFNDITHVTLSSEGLIPEAELEVATKNEEALSTMSLEMNDISTTQNALQETSDIQSENVDATMIATTEIYEGLL